MAKQAFLFFILALVLGVLDVMAKKVENEPTFPSPAQTATENATAASTNQTNEVEVAIKYNLTSGASSHSAQAKTGSCGGSGARVTAAYFNMSDRQQECPSGLNLTLTPVRGCGRRTTEISCDSIKFPITNFTYSKVWGQVHAYQRGSSSAFYNSIVLGQTSIEDAYISGISLTHGEPGQRKHIWTFAGAVAENYTSSSYACPCTNTDYIWQHEIPSFIGENYFCDSGFHVQPEYESVSPDPLWDGKGCGQYSTCCTYKNAPFFCLNLEQLTTDDIELRLCSADVIEREDKYISYVEIYVM